MHYSIISGTAEKQRTACAVIGVFDKRRLSDAGKQIDAAGNGFLAKLLKRGDLDGKAGQTLLLHDVPGVVPERVLLLGCGNEKEFDANAFRKAIAAAARSLKETGARDAVYYLTDLTVKNRDLHWKLRQAVQLTEDSFYRFDTLKSKKNGAATLTKIAFNVSTRDDIAGAEDVLRQAQAISEGMELAKNLGNLPPNVCTPSYLAEQAQELRKRYKSIKVQVLELQDMEKLGMGALLSVARGSRQPPKFIIIEHRGAAKGDKPVVLVGKGVTFDSGGISIKPAAAMDEMKFDMCGAASVLGTINACAVLQLAQNVIGVIPSSENLPDGNASKPGDIVTSLSGQTIEILNTDAEGRLLLCDALSYSERFDPAVVIDIATLTGACVIALGKHASGLLSNDSALTQDLLRAGNSSGDRVWELPLWEEYQDQLKSNFADMANVGGRDGGTITAACFLARFTKKFRWAHLDIAGTAWKSGDQKGATGRPVPLLTQFLIDRGTPTAA